MTRTRVPFAVFTLLLWTVTASGQHINTLTEQETAQGWQLLFDGNTLTGWHSSAPATASARAGAPQPAQPGQVGSSPKPCSAASGESTSAVPAGGSHWEVVDGLLMPCGEPTGYLASDRRYKNFVLSIEFRCGDDTNSGVFVRSPDESGGYEVQIWRQQPAGFNTGSIVGTAKTARAFALEPDRWNLYQITANGERLTVMLNGETTLDVRDDKFPEGHIRLQYQQFPIAFRNIKIHSLP